MIEVGGEGLITAFCAFSALAYACVVYVVSFFVLDVQYFSSG